MPTRTKGITDWPRLERFVLDRGCSFVHVPNTNLRQLDKKASLNNQARLGQPLDEATVERYTQDVLNTSGEHFPPLLVRRAKKPNTYISLDGNHRWAGFEAAEQEEIPNGWFICEGPEEGLKRIAREANGEHGLPSSVADRVSHALEDVRELGLSEAEAAARHGAPLSRVKAALTRIKIDEWAAKHRINARAWRALKQGVRSKLGKVHTGEGFRALTQLVIEAGLDEKEVTALVAGINRTKEAAEQVQFVADARDSLANRIAARKAGGSPVADTPHASPRRKLASALTFLRDVPENVGLVIAGLDAEEREALRIRMQEGFDRLGRLLKELTE